MRVGVRRRSGRQSGAPLLMGAFFVVALFGPLLRMLRYLAQVDILAVLRSATFGTALVNSLRVALVSTCCSVALALALAWCVTRCVLWNEKLVCAIFALPILIPSISHGMGLLLLFGKNGIFTILFGLEDSLYGFWGIVGGSVLYSFPVAFLMLTDILRYEDGSVYEAADLLGISRVRQIGAITMPYLSRSMISVVFSVFALVITDYGVPLMIGGKYTTLPVLMYQDVIGLLDFGKGSIIGIVLLVPAATAFLFDLLTQRQCSAASVVCPVVPRAKKQRDIPANILCVVCSGGILLPVVSFAALTFMKKYPQNTAFTVDNMIKSMEMGAGRYFINSVLIALGTAILGTALAYTAAYITARTKGRGVKLVHLASVTSLAVPGIVLGLSYVLFFKGTVVYGTMGILILVNIVHFFGPIYLIAYNALEKMNQNLENVGQTLGVKRIYMIRDVIIPGSRATLLEMFSYYFVNSMVTISAVSFLSSLRNTPLALMITQFEAQSLLECSAVVTLLILLVNLCVKRVIGRMA